MTHPLAVIDTLDEAHRVFDWMSSGEGGRALRVTFAFVVDTRPIYRDAGLGGSVAHLVMELEADGRRLLHDVRAMAPSSVSVTVRLLKRPASHCRQILDAIDDSSEHDALLLPVPAGAGVLDPAGRLSRRLRARSPIPVIVLAPPPLRLQTGGVA
jgi:hypothetical protein